MQKIIVLSLLFVSVVFSSFAQAAIKDKDLSTAGTGVAVTSIVNQEWGASIIIMEIYADLSTGKGSLDTRAKKELLQKINDDIQEYNLSGELSPILSDIITASQKFNSDLSTEDVLANLENLLK